MNFKKSEFFQSKIVFLGRVFNVTTKSTKKVSVAWISQLLKEYDLHSLRVFLGLTGHFRGFIKDYAMKIKCITKLMQKNIRFDWAQECDSAYHDIVRAISSNPILSLPDFALSFELSPDASHHGAGAVLYQQDAKQPPHKQLRVVGYHSYSWNKAELNCTIAEKEALAVLNSVRCFRCYLERISIKLFTDHQALTSLVHITQPKGQLAR